MKKGSAEDAHGKNGEENQSGRRADGTAQHQGKTKVDGMGILFADVDHDEQKEQEKKRTQKRLGVHGSGQSEGDQCRAWASSGQKENGQASVAFAEGVCSGGDRI